LGGFLLGCAGQAEKPADLAITEKDPSRCKRAWLNFENYHADITKRNQNIQVEILTGTAAQQFLAAYNLSPPPSNLRGNRIALFAAPGIIGTLVAIISRDNCVKMAGVYQNIAVQMWRLGRPGFPSSSPTPNSGGPKTPSI
jgi:hypothetical protein